MSGFKETALLTKIALLIAVTDGIFLIAGFASSRWQIGQANGDTVSYGLWFRCTEPNGTLTCLPYSTVTGQDTGYQNSLRTARGLEFTGFICLCLVCMFGFVYTYYTRLQRRAFAFILALLSYTAIVTMFAGLLVYGVSLVLPNFALGWSFATTVLAMLFAIPMAVFLTMEIFNAQSVV